MNLRDFYTSREAYVTNKWDEVDKQHGLTFIPEVYDHFVNEYKQSGMLYSQFVFEKNLGLIANITKATEEQYGFGVHSDYYKIVDDKQWMLAKLKYGI